MFHKRIEGSLLGCNLLYFWQLRDGLTLSQAIRGGMIIYHPFFNSSPTIDRYCTLLTSHVLGQHKWRASWSSKLAFDYWLFIGMLLVCQRHTLTAVLI